MECINCGKPAEYECQTCGDYFCEDCFETPTYKNGLEETICENCYEIRQQAASEDYYNEEQKKEKKVQEKKERNEKQRRYYHSPKQVEKRRLKKIELQKERRKQSEKIIRDTVNCIKGFFN